MPRTIALLTLQTALRVALCGLTGLVLFQPGDMRAEAQQSLAVDTMRDTTSADAAGIGFRNGSFVLAPIPLSNPTLGSGLILGAGYLFSVDAASDASHLALGAMRTDNGSTAYGASVSLSFAENRWALGTTFGRADLNYDLSGPGVLSFLDLPVSQSGDLVSVTLDYRLSDRIKLGFEATWLSTTVQTDGVALGGFPVLPGFGIDVEQVIAGPTLEWDTLDDAIYPTSGTNAKLWAQRGVGLDGFDAEFWKYVLQAKAFAPLGARGVVGGSVTACEVDGEAPFFNLCAIGLTDGLRGYAIGRFFGPTLLSGQIEYRARFTDRIGGVAFAGASGVAPDFEALDAARFKSAAGLGLRYRLSRQFPLDFSVDGVRNEDGDDLLYIYVGQAF
ncbi:MAG: BamA/TamA family outer membrane protein [Pseudomonadota bacterium]